MNNRIYLKRLYIIAALFLSYYGFHFNSISSDQKDHALSKQYFIIDIQNKSYEAIRNRKIAANIDHWSIIRCIEPITFTESEITRKNLVNAFEAPNSKGVVIYLESGNGGLLASCDPIVEAIRALKKQYDKPVIFVSASHICSADYSIALEADEIYTLSANGLCGSVGLLNVLGNSARVNNNLHYHNMYPDIKILYAGKYKLSYTDTLPFEHEVNEKAIRYMREYMADKFKQMHIDLLNKRKNLDLDLYKKHNIDQADTVTATIAVEMGLIDGILSTSELKARIGNCELFDYFTNTFATNFGDIELMNKIAEVEKVLDLQYNAAPENMYNTCVFFRNEIF